jgi:hypothetical protein
MMVSLRTSSKDEDKRKTSRVQKPAAFGELFGSDCRQSQQVVGAIFDHVDAEIIARIDGKPGRCSDECFMPFNSGISINR